MNEFLVTCQHQATAFDLPFYDIFAPTKNSCFEVSDDVIACDLRFGPPQSKILATSMGGRMMLKQEIFGAKSNAHFRQYQQASPQKRLLRYGRSPGGN